MTLRLRFIFFALWLFVIAVSNFDGYLVFRHRYLMLAFEKNPIGHALLRWNEGRVWYLLTAKLIGTIAVCGTLLSIWHFSRRLGLILTSAVAIVQLGVMLFLVIG